MKFAISPSVKNLAQPLLAAIVLRMIWMSWVEVIPLSDSFAYHVFAKNIALGHGFAWEPGKLTAFWPVGTPAVYSVLYSLFGFDFSVIELFNLLLGALLVLFTGLVGHQYFGPTVARYAAWFMALWPVFIQFTTILASELLFSTLLMAVVYLAGLPHRRLAWAPLWSVLLVGAIYVRPVALPLLLLIPMSIALEFRRWKEAAAVLAIALAMYAALSAPWKARNESIWGSVGVMSTNFGTNLWMGNNPDSSGGFMNTPERDFGNEYQRNEILKQESLKFIMGHPLNYLKLCARRVVDTFSRESIGTAWNQIFLSQNISRENMWWMKLVASIYWWVMLIFGVGGAIIAIRTSRLKWHSTLLTTPAVIAAPAILIVSQDRYHLPMDPFLAILAALMVSLWIHRRRCRLRLCAVAC